MQDEYLKEYPLEYECVQTQMRWRFKRFKEPNKAPTYEREDGRKYTRNRLLNGYAYVGREFPREKTSNYWATNPVTGFKYRVRREYSGL